MATPQRQNNFRFFKTKWESKCKVCKTPIAIGAGFTFKPSARQQYVKVCTSKTCIAECMERYNCTDSLKAFIDKEFSPNAPNPRQCDKGGFCTYPFDRSVNEIMRGLGGRFNANHPSGNKGWQMPLDIGLRSNIVTVLTSANFEIDPQFGNIDQAVMGAVEEERNAHLKWAVEKGLY